MRIVQLMTDRSRYFNPSKNYWFISFNAFLISLYFRCLSFRVVLVNTALPDGVFLWFFFSLRFFFRTTRELESAKLFPLFNIRLYDKNSESNYFFFLHHNQNIFSVTLGIRICFLDERTSVLGFKFTKCFDLQRFVFLIVVKLTEEIMFN